jgi:hypothetical protein
MFETIWSAEGAQSYVAPSGLIEFHFMPTRGVAPGYYISRLQRENMGSFAAPTGFPL